MGFIVAGISIVMRISFIIFISFLFLSIPFPDRNTQRHAYSEEKGDIEFLQILEPQGAFSTHLIDTAWLIKHIQDDGLILLDARSPRDYIEGHIPGAVPVDMEVLFPDFLTLPPNKNLQELIGSYGIDNETTVVIYDEGNGLYASLIFWLLDYTGLKNIAILNGGLKEWEEDGQPLEKEVRTANKVSFIPSWRTEAFVDTGWVLKNKDSPLVIILDVRSSAEYLGVISPNARGGHIPGAKNIPWTKNLDLDGRTFRDIKELRMLYELYGATDDKTIVIYSQTLLRATHTFFVLKVLGYQDVRLFRSFKEWADRADLPLEKGD